MVRVRVKASGGFSGTAPPREQNMLIKSLSPPFESGGERRRAEESGGEQRREGTLMGSLLGTLTWSM